MSTVDNPVDVYVVGTGMVGYAQLTREVESAFAESEAVYLLDTTGPTNKYIEEEFGADVYNLGELYEEGTDRRETYDRMADVVLSAAEEAQGPVTFALYGHPMIFVNPSRQVVDRGTDRGLKVDVLPGISSLDAVFCDAGFDPAENGLQTFEATDLLVREWELNPEVPAMIWQVSVVETTRHTERESRPGRFTRFREYLERFYPADHTAHLLQTAIFPVADSKDIPVEIGRLEERTEALNNGYYILYIPPVRERSVQNEELAEKVKSREHLEEITADDVE
ncbi:SAM-dependent methyltransferase [Salinigranum sp.]|uniref:SAM-dependent methyltransferase n=1 Tax=Salinigranum sp. TaxID=1966351 RepID=UPI00356617C9